jgi:hypothetical protein
MLLLSQLQPPSEHHISDFLMHVLFDPEIGSKFRVDEPEPFVVALLEDDPRIVELGNRQAEWAPGVNTNVENVSLGYQPGTGIFQYARMTRRVVSLSDWGRTRIGYLRNIPIHRRNVACYVANKLGGVHYDSTRLPAKESDADEFRKLAVSYDWDTQAVMHAGLVAVALMCVELARMPWYFELLSSLERFHESRQQRLVQGLPVA